jgi:hypothetical protein
MRIEQHDAKTAPEILSWRRRQLVEAGFSQSLAGEVANEAAYDLHALIDLVDRGCPPELAVRILAPLDGGSGV